MTEKDEKQGIIPTSKSQKEPDKGVTPIIIAKKEGDSKDLDPILNTNINNKTMENKFTKNIGRFSRIPKKELIKISSAAGKAGLGVTRKRFTKCIDCDIRHVCRRAFEEAKKGRARGENWTDDEARCVYEIEGRQAIKDRDMRDYKAFVSADPVDLLVKIQTTFKQLEAVVEKDPSYTKLTNLLYLMMNIYRLKFGEKAFVVNVTKNMDNSPSMDIKKIMNEIRADKKVIDITGGDVPKKD